MNCYEQKNININKIIKKLLSSNNKSKHETINSMNCKFEVLKYDNKKASHVISVSLWKRRAAYIFNLSSSLLSWVNLRDKYWPEFTIRIYTDISIFLPLDQAEKDSYVNEELQLLSLKIISLLMAPYLNDLIDDFKYSLFRSGIIELNLLYNEMISVYQTKNLFEIKDNKIKITKINKNNMLMFFKKFCEEKENIDDPIDKLLLQILKDKPELVREIINEDKFTEKTITELKQYNRDNINFIEQYVNINEKNRDVIINNIINEINNILQKFRTLVEDNNKFELFMPIINFIYNIFSEKDLADIIENIKNINTLENLKNVYYTLVKKLYNTPIYRELEKKFLINIDVDWISLFEQLLKHNNVEIWLYNCQWEYIDKECSYNNTFGSIMRYQPIFDKDVKICIIRNIELLTSEKDRAYYNDWLKSGITVFDYMLNYTCNEIYKKVCNSSLKDKKTIMMASQFNINKTTTWFINNKFDDEVWNCIQNIFYKRFGNLKPLNKYNEQNFNLPQPFYNFEYGVDEVILTLCIKDKIANKLIINDNDIENCEMFIINIRHNEPININDFINDTGLRTANDKQEYTDDIKLKLIKMFSSYFLLNKIINKKIFANFDPISRENINIFLSYANNSIIYVFPAVEIKHKGHVDITDIINASSYYLLRINNEEYKNSKGGFYHKYLKYKLKYIAAKNKLNMLR